MYGTQTFPPWMIVVFPFENDVEMYGTQTVNNVYYRALCLRMM